MKATRLFGIGDFRTVNVDIPKLKKDEILIEVEACGLCGSDIPRIYELGTSKKNYPITLGHEFSGRVIEVKNPRDNDLLNKKVAVFPCVPCKKCDMCKTGNYAHCKDYDYLGSRIDGGFAEYCIIPSRWNLITVDDEVNSKFLAMTEPATVAQHALRIAKAKFGDKIVIIGAGPIGCMAYKWSKILGASKVLLLEINDSKVEALKKLGYNILNSSVDNLNELIVENLKSSPNIVIEGTGTSSATNIAIDIASDFANVIFMGNSKSDITISHEMHSKILRKELNISGTWNSYYENFPINEWRYTINKITSNELDLSDLISHELDIEEIPKITSEIYDRKVESMKVLMVNKND